MGREPFFSPDGQWIGFWQNNQLKKVSVSGGAAVTLCDAQNPWGASWGLDDMILYGQGAAGIWQVPGTGGTPEQVIELDDGGVAHGPQRLDSEWVLFTLRASVGSWNDAQIVMQSLTTGERTVLISGGRDARYLPTGHLVYGLDNVLYAVPVDLGQWTVRGGPVPLVEGVMDADTRTGGMHFSVSADGALVYVPGGASERRTLVWVDREGREEPLAADPLPYYRPRISPDGTRIAVEVADPSNSDLNVYDIARDTLTRLTFDPGPDTFPLWTPDSQRVLFRSVREGGGLFSKAADGTGDVERLTTNAAGQFPYSWSADGQTLVFEQLAADTLNDLYTLSLDGEPTAEVLLQTAAREFTPKVSPDGRWVAYASTASGRPEVYVQPFPNLAEGRWQISTDGGVWPLWSPDGRELLYRAFVPNQAVTVPIDGTATFRPGNAEPLFNMGPYFTPGGPAGTNWDIAPDGERFVLLMSGTASTTEDLFSQPQMIIVRNWFEELKARVPIP